MHDYYITCRGKELAIPEDEFRGWLPDYLVIEKALKARGFKWIFRSKGDRIVTLYFGHRTEADMTIDEYLEARKKLIGIELFKYGNGTWGIYDWRDIIRALPRRKRCQICHRPSRLWTESNHGRTKKSNARKYNCLGEYSEEFKYILWTYTPEYQSMVREKRRLTRVNNKRKEEKLWLEKAKQGLRDTRRVIRDLSQSPKEG